MWKAKREANRSLDTHLPWNLLAEPLHEAAIYQAQHLARYAFIELHHPLPSFPAFVAGMRWNCAPVFKTCQIFLRQSDERSKIYLTSPELRRKVRRMDYDDIVRFYGSASRAADNLGVERATVSHWRKNGIPKGRQAQIHMLTRGRLKADPDAVRPNGLVKEIA